MKTQHFGRINRVLSLFNLKIVRKKDDPDVLGSAFNEAMQNLLVMSILVESSVENGGWIASTYDAERKLEMVRTFIDSLIRDSATKDTGYFYRNILSRPDRRQQT